MDYGTPQGIILGPLIFILFLNNLPQLILTERFLMYANDTTIVVSAENRDIGNRRV